MVTNCIVVEGTGDVGCVEKDRMLSGGRDLLVDLILTLFIAQINDPLELKTPILLELKSFLFYALRLDYCRERKRG